MGYAVFINDVRKYETPYLKLHNGCCASVDNVSNL